MTKTKTTKTANRHHPVQHLSKQQRRYRKYDAFCKQLDADPDKRALVAAIVSGQAPWLSDKGADTQAWMSSQIGDPTCQGDIDYMRAKLAQYVTPDALSAVSALPTESAINSDLGAILAGFGVPSPEGDDGFDVDFDA